MIRLIEWKAVGYWMPTLIVGGAILGLLGGAAHLQYRAIAQAYAARAEAIADRDRIGGQLNATQQLLTSVQGQLHKALLQAAPVCPPTVQAVREDVGHDTPIFSRW